MSDSVRPYGEQPSGSSVHGILQARMLEWVAIPFSLIQPVGIFCFGWHVKEIWSLAHIFLEKEDIFE